MGDKNGILTVISGPAGSGKGTAVKLLFERVPDLSLSVSATTRAPRPGEIDGVHYYFISKDEFREKIAAGEILEYTEYCGNYYGTPAKAVRDVLDTGRDVILEIEVDGASQIKKKFPDAVTVMLLPPDGKTLEARLRGRGTETDEVIAARMARAREEISLFGMYDYIVISRDGEAGACAADIASILTAEHAKRERMTSLAENFFS